MLDVYTQEGWMPIPSPKEYFIDFAYDGTQMMSFDLAINDKMANYLKNEALLRNEYNRYLLKAINARKTQCTYICELDMDEWHFRRPYMSTKDISTFQTKTLSEVLEKIKPQGWSIQNAHIRATRKTIELEGATDYDVLMECQSAYDVTYDIDVLHKVIRVIDPNQVVDKGVYITPQLNLKELIRSGETSNFATRLVAYGAKQEDGSYLSFRDINNGNDYVSDNSYSNKVVWAYWHDERYKLKENLLDAARKKLRELSHPEISFQVTVNDIASCDDKYAFLTLSMYDIAHVLIDDDTSVIEKIIEVRIYPDKPDKKVLTLSSKPQSIKSHLDKVASLLGDEGEKVVSSVLEEAQNKATELINAWATKGYVYKTQNEIYILDKLPKERAVCCIRMNLGGIAFSKNGWAGPYSTAWTIDGRFNADFITGGTIRGIKLIGNEISNGNNFSVDADGNLKAVDAEFEGNISGSTIEGSRIEGSTLISGYDDSNQTIIRSGRSNFLYNGKDIGDTGTNYYKGHPEIAGLVFDLNPEGSYMSFAAQEKDTDDSYIWKLIYTSKAFASYLKDTLNLGCPLDTQSNGIYLGAKGSVKAVRYVGGAGISMTGNNSFCFTHSTSSGDDLLLDISNSGISAYCDINMNGNSILNQSDSRLKRNVKPNEKNCLGILNAMNLVSFDWIMDEKHEAIGAIADQVESVESDLVVEDDEGIKSIKTSDLIWYLIGAVQQLSKEVQRLGGSIKEINPKNKVATKRKDILPILEGKRYKQPSKPNITGHTKIERSDRHGNKRSDNSNKSEVNREKALTRRDK